MPKSTTYTEPSLSEIFEEFPKTSFPRKKKEGIDCIGQINFVEKAVRLGVATALTEISCAPHGLFKATEHRRISINALDEFFTVHLLR